MYIPSITLLTQVSTRSLFAKAFHSIYKMARALITFSDLTPREENVISCWRVRRGPIFWVHVRPKRTRRTLAPSWCGFLRSPRWVVSKLPRSCLSLLSGGQLESELSQLVDESPPSAVVEAAAFVKVLIPTRLEVSEPLDCYRRRCLSS